MAFLRITIARPRPELRNEVRQHFRELIEATSAMPGFISGYALDAPGASGEVGRVTVWETPEAANHAANDPRVLAIHSRLMLDSQDQLQDWDMNASFVVERRA